MRTLIAISTVLVTILGQGEHARPQAANAARELVEQAIRSHGGADLLVRLRVQLRTGKGEITPPIGASSPYAGEELLHLPEQGRWTYDLNPETDKVRVILGLSGGKGWRLSGGAAQDLSKEELEAIREQAYVEWLTTLLPLREQRFELTGLAETKINGRPAQGVSVASKGNPDVKLYFDKQTGLLIKTERRGRDGGLTVVKEHFFSEHKDFDGLKLPMRRVEVVAGKKRGAIVFTGWKFLPRADESAFAKP